MDSGKAFAGFPLRDIHSPAIRWQGERQSQVSDPVLRKDFREHAEHKRGSAEPDGEGVEKERVIGFFKEVAKALEMMASDLGIAEPAGLEARQGDLAQMERCLVSAVGQCQTAAVECKRYSEAADRMLQIAHDRHSSLRSRAARLTRAVAERIHLTNVAAAFDLWVSSLRKVRDERRRLETIFARMADASPAVDLCWSAWRHAVHLARAEARLEDEEAGRLAAEERWKAADDSQRHVSAQLLELQQELQRVKGEGAVLQEEDKDGSGKGPA